MLSFARQVKPSPRAGCLEGWVLEAMMLGVPFCELGREGKTGVQVHFPALGGPLGFLMQKLGRVGILYGGRGVGGMSRWFTEVAAGRTGWRVCSLRASYSRGFSSCEVWALEGWLSRCGAWA